MNVVKKIVFMHHTNIIGGGSLSLFDIIDCLSDTNYSPHVVFPKSNSASSYLKSKCLDDSYEYTEVDCPFITLSNFNGGPNLIFMLFKFLRNIFFVFKWNKLIRNMNEEIFVLNSIVQVPLVLLLKYHNKKVICCVRETKQERRGIVNLLMSRLLDMCDCVTFLTKFDMLNWSLIKADTYILPDIVNLKYSNIEQRGTSKSFNRDSLTLLYTGGANYLKGYDVLLESLTYLNIKLNVVVCGVIPPKINLRFIILRTQLYLFHVKCQSLKLQINKNIKITVFGKMSNVEELINKCDVIVIPFNIAHQSRNLYEAGYFKKPVIISDFTCYEDNVIDGFNCITFNPNDPRDLADKISLFYSKPTEEVILMGQNNHSMTISNHNHETVSKLFINILSNVG
ncbi:glycosyltransferase [Halosquirtibacter xylanolyticus]|uniref:glycosyltransferase n=1 Tax=Halosquirtibacter xylanolyticus TaxID=3374599 RepID=UPI00374A725C|nr:glycosyltransferase [Prolixibacteraceae bacterium]